MEALIILAGLAFTVNKVVAVIKAIGKDMNLVATQVLVWVLGTLALFLAANAELTAGFAVPGTSNPLGDLDLASVILLGLILGSSGSFAYDGLKAVDNTQSAAEPPLLRRTP